MRPRLPRSPGRSKPSVPLAGCAPPSSPRSPRPSRADRRCCRCPAAPAARRVLNVAGPALPPRTSRATCARRPDVGIDRGAQGRPAQRRRVGAAAEPPRAAGRPGHWLLALPATHIAGLQVLVRSLAAGTEPVALDLADGFDPSFAAATVRRLGGTAGRRYTALVPTSSGMILDAAARARRAARVRRDPARGRAARLGLLHRAREAGVPW